MALSQFNNDITREWLDSVLELGREPLGSETTVMVKVICSQIGQDGRWYLWTKVSEVEPNEYLEFFTWSLIERCDHFNGDDEILDIGDVVELTTECEVYHTLEAATKRARTISQYVVSNLADNDRAIICIEFRQYNPPEEFSQKVLNDPFKNWWTEYDGQLVGITAKYHVSDALVRSIKH